MVPRRLYWFLSALLLLSACKDEFRPELVHFAFVIPVRFSPGGDTVALGDTLWLTADFSDSLLDLRSQQRYRMREQDIKLRSVMAFYKLLGAGQLPASYAQGFTVVNQVGQLAAPTTTFRRFEPVYDGQRFRARIGIIPQARGIYALSLLSSLEPPYRPGKVLPFLAVPPDAKGNPQRAILDDIYYIINDGNTHFALQQQNSHVVSTQPNSPELSVYYEQKGTFTFVVR